MGRYTTEILQDEDYKRIIGALRTGYRDGDHFRRPNDQAAAILVLQTNLGCRIGDIVALAVESFTYDGQSWRLDIHEEKTGKARRFIVPAPVKAYIDTWMSENGITSGRLFTVSEAAVWKVLRQVTGYLGLKDVSAHSFRKSAALRVYLDSGKDLALTSQFLNHSNSAVTLLYLKRTTKQMDDILSASVSLA